MFDIVMIFIKQAIQLIVPLIGIKILFDFTRVLLFSDKG